MDLFDYMRQNTMEKESPLASRLRPETLDEIVGQQHILGKDKLLYRAIKADKLSSIILYGPPGTGKTTIARVIANTTRAVFTQMNATVAGKKDMEKILRKYTFLNDTGFGQLVKLAFLFTNNENLENANADKKTLLFFKMYVQKELVQMIKQRIRTKRNLEAKKCELKKTQF